MTFAHTNFSSLNALTSLTPTHLQNLSSVVTYEGNLPHTTATPLIGQVNLLNITSDHHISFIQSIHIFFDCMCSTSVSIGIMFPP